MSFIILCIIEFDQGKEETESMDAQKNLNLNYNLHPAATLTFENDYNSTKRPNTEGVQHRARNQKMNESFRGSIATSFGEDYKPD